VHDLVVRNARLRGAGSVVTDIGISGGHIAALGEALAGRDVVDADGALVTPSFVDAHLHLDKVHTWDQADTTALRAYTTATMGAADAIARASAVKDAYDEATIERNAREVMLDGLRHGVTHVRAFADTDTRAGLRGVRPLLALRDELRGLVHVEVVAFPQDGVLRDPGAAGVVEEAVRLGADLVGGIPWIEDTEEEAVSHIEQMLAVARRHDRDVAMLTDDAGDPGLRTTELLALAALEHGWTGRVTVCHARALALYPQPQLLRLLRLAARAGMAFVANPHTAPLAMPVTTMLDAGIPVALAQDDVADAYYPFGQHNLLEVAFLAAHLLNMTTQEDMDRLLDMITVHAARALRLERHQITVGAPAHLVVLEGEQAREVLLHHRPPRHVISHGILRRDSSRA
jgi:cytosine deaminase